MALTSNGDESAVADVDDVVTTDGLRVFGVGVGDQRTNATPGRQDIPSPHWEPKTPETLTMSDSWSVCGVYLIDRTTIGYAIVFMQCPVYSYICSYINMTVMSALKAILFNKRPKGNMGSEIVHKTWVALLNQQTVTRTLCMSPESISLLWWHIKH